MITLDEEVGRLDVAVEDAVLVGVVEGFGGLDAELGDGAEVLAGLSKSGRVERAAMGAVSAVGPASRAGLESLRSVLSGSAARLAAPTWLSPKPLTPALSRREREMRVAQLLHYLRQALAFDELHGVVVDAAFDADGVDRDDVRVVERGGGAGFVLEAGELLLVEHRGEGQHFQGDAAAERDLLGFVDDAHAAAADLAEDAEVAEVDFARCWMLDTGCWMGRGLVGQLRSDVLHEVEVAETFGQLVGHIGIFGEQCFAVERLPGGHGVHDFFHCRNQAHLRRAPVARWMRFRNSADSTARFVKVNHG